MKVKDLIKILQTLDQEKGIGVYEYGYEDISTINDIGEIKTVHDFKGVYYGKDDYYVID